MPQIQAFSARFLGLISVNLNEKFAQTIVVITHNEELAQETNENEDGRIVSDSGVTK